MNFDADRLSSLKFNPLLFDNHKYLALSSDLDPDSNYFSNESSCDYYIEHSLNEMFVKKAPNSDCHTKSAEISIVCQRCWPMSTMDFRLSVSQKPGYKIHPIPLILMAIILFIVPERTDPLVELASILHQN